MNLNELRSGNWVGVSAYGFEPIKQWSPFDFIKIHEKDVSGIPLTEEWLVKFGFNSTTELVLNEVCKGFGIEIDEFTWLCINNKDASLMDITDKHVILLHNPIKYIHQLQNLYFALTGEELTVK